MKPHIKLFVVLLIGSSSVFGQDQIKELLKGSTNDINYLANTYATPALKAVGAGLNQGWYNTAKPHKLLGFDITVAPSLISIPENDLTFKVDNSKLEKIALIDASGTAPTMAGYDKPKPQFAFKNPQTGVPDAATKFEGPGGLNLKDNTSGYLPVPTVTAGIGLPKGFEVRFRYIPQTKLSGTFTGQVDMIGFGLMHDIKQYIPVISQLPFDLSIFGGYTKLNLEAGLDNSKPDNKAIFQSTATTVQAIISKKISVLTIYGSAGYNFATTSLAVKGSYDVGTTLVPLTIKDPVNMSVSGSGPRVTAGMRLKLLILTIHADYTLQDYSAITAGVGLSIR